MFRCGVESAKINSETGPVAGERSRSRKMADSLRSTRELPELETENLFVNCNGEVTGDLRKNISVKYWD